MRCNCVCLLPFCLIIRCCFSYTRRCRPVAPSLPVAATVHVFGLCRRVTYGLGANTEKRGWGVARDNAFSSRLDFGVQSRVLEHRGSVEVFRIRCASGSRLSCLRVLTKIHIHRGTFWNASQRYCSLQSALVAWAAPASSPGSLRPGTEMPVGHKFVSYCAVVPEPRSPDIRSRPTCLEEDSPCATLE
jgi:hypothetical protein